jgi:hypothetical protein
MITNEYHKKKNEKKLTQDISIVHLLPKKEQDFPKYKSFPLLNKWCHIGF